MAKPAYGVVPMSDPMWHALAIASSRFYSIGQRPSFEPKQVEVTTTTCEALVRRGYFERAGRCYRVTKDGRSTMIGHALFGGE